MPRAVTLTLPFYNAESTLSECLDSIVNQTLSDFSLIAVDDGSSDRSADILQHYAERDPRIRLIRRNHEGVVAASNHAIEMADTPYVARIDADDTMSPERLFEQLAYLQRHREITLLGCQVDLFPPESIGKGLREYIRWQNGCIEPQQIADEVYVELPIANPTIMFRREAIAKLGGYRSGPFPEDYDLQLRLVQQGMKLAKLPKALVQWREGCGRLTRTDPRYSRAAFDHLRASFLAEDPRLHGDRKIVVWGAGRKSRKRASLLLEHGITFDAWIDIDPNKIGNIVQGIRVQPPDWLAQQERPFILSYVTNHGAKELIAADLIAMGYRRGEDYLMVG